MWYKAKNDKGLEQFRILGLKRFVRGIVDGDILHITATCNRIGEKETPIIYPIDVPLSILTKITEHYEMSIDIKEEIYYEPKDKYATKVFKDLHLLKFVRGEVNGNNLIIESTMDELNLNNKKTINSKLSMSLNLLEKITRNVKVGSIKKPNRFDAIEERIKQGTVYGAYGDNLIHSVGTCDIVMRARTAIMKKAFKDLHLKKYVDGTLDAQGMLIITSTGDSLDLSNWENINYPIKVNFSDLSSNFVDKPKVKIMDVYRDMRRGIGPHVYVYGEVHDDFVIIEAIIKEGIINCTGKYKRSKDQLIRITPHERARILNLIIEKGIENNG